MMSELDAVVLTRDKPEHGLKAGDIGAVVHVSAAGGEYEVEFVTADGATLAVLTLPWAAIRPIGSGEILHARTLTSA